MKVRDIFGGILLGLGLVALIALGLFVLGLVVMVRADHP
jgi:hypothetical protein